jgi:mono/diheme cytochrome c family protein
MRKSSLVIMATLVMMAGLMAFNFGGNEFDAPLYTVKKDSAVSVAAFKDVYKVLMSPRCMNCHPSGNIPLQGDDSHLHTMLPKRGVDGKGVYAMKCMNCHQPTNTPGLHTPPGNPKWHLPPANVKMVFQGRTAHQLARQLIDPKQNGHKNLQKLIEHADDELVLAGWHPGEGRTLPPMSHAAFKKAWITWLTTGAFAPKKD